MTEKTEADLPINNHLLAALSPAQSSRMFSKMEKIALIYEECLYQKNELIRYAYFPTSGIISLLTSVEEGSTLEIGLIGKEGVVGLPLFLGVKTSNVRAVVQGSGSAMRMNAEDFISECENGGDALPRILQRFAHSRLTQASQSAACYRFHPIEARLARWLLMTSDRMDTDDFLITQEFLSNMLGVRREAVNKSAVSLQQEKLIDYNRGHISIINRPGLEKATCLCYAIIKEEEKSFPVRF